MDYDNDLKPLYDLIASVFNDKIEGQLLILYKKYKEDFLISDTSQYDFNLLIKESASLVYSYLSSYYIKKTLSKYFSSSGIVFFIITNITLKSKLFYENLK